MSNRIITFRQQKTFPLMQTRSFISLPMQIIQTINMLTLDPKFPPKIVGSYKYVIHEYPNDIDLFESYEGCCGFEQVRKNVIKRFQDMIQEIEANPLTYLGDFKAGYDSRYTVDIGEIDGSKIRGYDHDAITKRMRELYDSKLLSENEIATWLRAVIEKPTLNEYIELKHLIHKKKTVRWTSKDILMGYKKLRGGHLLSLEDALSQKSIVKIDVWTNISGRYTEVTNWYAITYLEDGSVHPKYMSEPLGDYQHSLVKDLEYYSNPTLKKSMKLAKRIWNYYVFKNMKKEMVMLYPLFSSGAAKMHQIIGEIETICSILKYVAKPDMESIKSNIEDWKTRMGTLLNDILPVSISNMLFDKINETLSSRSKQQIINLISDIKYTLDTAVDKAVKKYFRIHRITNPIAIL